MNLQAPPQVPSRPARDPNGAGTFLAWAATGACLGTGLVTALSIGPFLLALVVIAAAVLIWRRRLGIATIGAVSGLGLAKDKPLIVYCGNLACPKSRELAEGLKASGFTALSVMPEGMEGWKAAGGPVEGQ